VTPANQGKVTRIALTGLANTTHTLVFKDPSAATTMGVVGVVTYKTKGTNVYVARCGWSGARIGHLFDPSTPLIDPNSQADSARRLGTLYWRGDSTATGDTDFPARPHLAIAAIGLNDNLNSVVSEDYFDAVTRLVRGLRRGVKDCSILLVAHNYPDTENTDSNDPSSRGAYWPRYVRAMLNTAEQLNCGFVSLFAKWGETPFADGWQGSGDGADVVIAPPGRRATGREHQRAGGVSPHETRRGTATAPGGRSGERWTRARYGCWRTWTVSGPTRCCWRPSGR
jgi:hypothetical protein